MSYKFISSPYSHPNGAVRSARYRLVSEVVAAFLKKGIIVFSPIVHCHQIAIRHNLPRDSLFWQNYNEVMLKGASELLVLTIPAWDISLGVQMEIVLAKKLGIPIQYINHPDIHYPSKRRK